MNLTELNAIKTYLEDQTKRVNSIQVNCLHCSKYQSGVCQQFEAAPPSDWMRGTVDCEHWSWDEIPF